MLTRPLSRRIFTAARMIAMMGGCIRKRLWHPAIEVLPTVTFWPLLAERACAWSGVQATLDRRQPRLYGADSLYQLIYEPAVVVASPA